jgi:hypothetical protein
MIQSEEELIELIDLTIEQQLSQKVLSINAETMSREQLRDCLLEIYEVSLRRGNFCDALAADRIEMATHWEATTLELAKALQLINQQASYLRIVKSSAELYKSLYESSINDLVSNTMTEISANWGQDA